MRFVINVTNLKKAIKYLSYCLLVLIPINFFIESTSVIHFPELLHAGMHDIFFSARYWVMSFAFVMPVIALIVFSSIRKQWATIILWFLLVPVVSITLSDDPYHLMKPSVLYFKDMYAVTITAQKDIFKLLSYIGVVYLLMPFFRQESSNDSNDSNETIK